MKKIIITILVLAILGFGVYLIVNKTSSTVEVVKDSDIEMVKGEVKDDSEIVEDEAMKDIYKEETVIGKSVEGRDIKAYHYGQGGNEVLLVGGVHGGYSWNTSLLAYEVIDYIKANPGTVSGNVKVTVIPTLNPDGLNKVTGKDGRFAVSDVSPSQSVQVSGRFNANKVDLNRNFSCGWKSTGTWQNTSVSGGAKAFSEAESLAIKNYVDTNKPKAVVIWYSAAGGVYSSACENGVIPATRDLTNLYSKASGYTAHDTFDFYETTGDMSNWLASVNIPAFSVLLTNHKDTEFTKNKAGIEAVLNYFSK